MKELRAMIELIVKKLLLINDLCWRIEPRELGNVARQNTRKFTRFAAEAILLGTRPTASKRLCSRVCREQVHRGQSSSSQTPGAVDRDW